MAQQKTNNAENKLKQNQGNLPVPIHPDDAKDKVFTAILRALIKMENKPSSPKELANIIVKHKYATLGGATPFATVSSRISQHFKRAAEHNPPRAPLLAKHIDQNHSRKINYSLATESVPAAQQDEEEDDEKKEDDERNLRKKSNKSHPTLRKSSRSRNEHKIEKVEDELHPHISKKRKVDQSSVSPSSTTSRRKSYTSAIEFTKSSTSDEEDSQNEHSDYHEEMLKGSKDELSIHTLKRPTHKQPNTSNAPPSITSSHEESSKPSLLTPHAPREGTGMRKPSFSFSSGYPGEQELWTPFTFEHDFDNVFIHDPSTAHHIPFNIATPESVSVSELDDYFGSTPSSSNPVSRSQRKSFCSTMLGPNDKSLLQKVLLSSAARGVADKIEEESETDIKKETNDKDVKVDVKRESIEKAEIKEEQEVHNSQISSQPVSILVTSASDEKSTDNKSLNSSTLMNVENSEDFVKFEEDEKKETLPTASNTAIAPTPILPAPTKRDILPASNTTPSTAALSVSELLKTMNIQNINLPALQQMTSNLQALQQLSPTFDLAKTMAIYMQSLTKSANVATNNTPSSSSSTTAPSIAQPTVDIKSILARFPALEALLRKDNNSHPNNNNNNNKSAVINPVPPPPVSATTDVVPNLVNVNSNESVVHTLTPTTPAMYITVIDHIAVCVVVLEKTETTPEHRIMRRLDTGFINGTALLAAGGIETESERSMILSFEMDRVRMPKKKSPLFGTWIPLRRAQELAITCSVQHKLGHFLEDSIESYFPSPLPIQMTARKPAANNRLTALALAALRSSDKGSGFAVSPISRQSSGTVSQLHELFLSNSHKALKSKAGPLLFDDQVDKKSSQKEENGEDTNHSDSGSSHDDESDTDVKHSILTGSALQELFTRASLPHPTHIHPKDLQKKRRRSSLPEATDEHKEHDDSQEEESKAKNARRRPGAGKWSSTAIHNSGGGGKLASYGIKKSASTGGSMFARRTPANGKRAQQKKVKEEDEEEEVRNMVVEHKGSSGNSSSSTSNSSNSQPTHPVTASQPGSKGDKKEEDNDEDEDIDIGGSDFDDDLR
ncbi:hypothetical protein G6F57_005392 [Rhizopus arrhizus]|uniref:HTH APSES-type domain-containing protein n=1 Tax=Rhizopus oryzae TaxID=64495 RepID=A0A9P6XHJ9_RHIOR|nr:hypothetical protein G6F21_000927 [Rhizopus arrhizus]KAG1424366.1 hypothetical protein G6F58_002416 [Rhizopus delemar]KAG0802334.1 hypothetical protein G6F22_000360 [Rhizopus arrhizus]KAG0812957.1 hypothetical protein G6F20_005939 [Rhizopus arrhizus]KAG0839454.1 hypothetical protein G6F19_002554 [Rhizopus arrhizus]